jgi:hypothetical protein
MLKSRTTGTQQENKALAWWLELNPSLFGQHFLIGTRQKAWNKLDYVRKKSRSLAIILCKTVSDSTYLLWPV